MISQYAAANNATITWRRSFPVQLLQQKALQGLQAATQRGVAAGLHEGISSGAGAAAALGVALQQAQRPGLPVLPQRPQQVAGLSETPDSRQADETGTRS